jgi:hypothetical protein
MGVLALDPLPATAVTYGSTVTLTGLGRGLSELELEERVPPSVTWTPNKALHAAADGSFSVAIKPAGPDELRVTSGGVSTPSTVVVMAPRVNLKPSADLTSLGGAVRPKLPLAPVQIQQLDESTGRWTTVAKTTVTAAGRFTVTLSALGGTYRARVAAGHGWAAGLSRKVLVR